MGREHYEKKNSYKISNFLDKFDVKKYGSQVRDLIINYLSVLSNEKGNILNKVFVDSGLTKTQVYKQMKIESKTLDGYLSLTPRRIPLENLLKFCLVLHLHPDITYYLLEENNYCLNKSELYWLYKQAIETYYYCSLEEINELFGSPIFKIN